MERCRYEFFSFSFLFFLSVFFFADDAKSITQIFLQLFKYIPFLLSAAYLNAVLV